MTRSSTDLVRILLGRHFGVDGEILAPLGGYFGLNREIMALLLGVLHDDTARTGLMHVLPSWLAPSRPHDGGSPAFVEMGERLRRAAHGR